jgi:exopolysaccharide production protein ExoQ
MSSMAQAAGAAERQREAVSLERASARVWLVKVVCALALSVGFWFSVPYRTLTQGPEDVRQAAVTAAASDDGALERQIALPIMALIALYMLWRLPVRGRFSGRLLTVVVLFLGWAAVSVVWSDSAAVTGKRLVVFAMDALLAYTIARTLSVMEMALWGFATTGCVALIALYVDAVQQRIFSVFNADYRFAGVMQPNYQAMNLVVCILCGLTVLQYREKAAKWLVPMIGFALGLLYLTRSRLSAAICLVLAAWMVMRLVRERMSAQTRAMVMVAGLMVLVPAVIYFGGQNAGGTAQSVFMMGRSDVENTSSLSNRAPLWTELVESAEARPLLGYGYGGYWTPQRLERVSLDQGWIVPHAHNTYLDEMLALGLVGVLLYAAAVWSGAVVAWRRYRAVPGAAALLPAILLTWLALTGVAESVPLDPYLPTMLAYACLVKMCLTEGSEAESDAGLEAGEIIGGLTVQRGG